MNKVLINLDLRLDREPALFHRLASLSSDYRTSAIRDLLEIAIKTAASAEPLSQPSVDTGPGTTEGDSSRSTFWSRLTFWEDIDEDRLLYSYFAKVPIGRRKKRARVLLLKGMMARVAPALSQTAHVPTYPGAVVASGVSAPVPASARERTPAVAPPREVKTSSGAHGKLMSSIPVKG